MVKRSRASFDKRARHLARRLWWTVLGLVIITVASFHLQPYLLETFAARAWGSVFPVIALAGLLRVRVYLGRSNDKGAFYGHEEAARTARQLIHHLVPPVPARSLRPLVCPGRGPDRS